MFLKKWLDIGFEFIAINPIMNQLEWDLSKLNNPYMDTADYSNTTALHFFNFATNGMKKI